MNSAPSRSNGIFRQRFHQQRAQQQHQQLSEDDEGESETDESPQQSHHPGNADLSEEDSMSDSGSILSTRESNRRTPEQLKKEEAIRKQALLLELTKMKRDGIVLTREFTDNDPIEVLESEITHRMNMAEEDTMVKFYKAGFQIAANGLEMANSFRGKPILPMEGWAKGVTWNMSMYNRPLRQIHRQSGFRGFGGNPYWEMGFLVIGSLVIHMIVNKMTGSTSGAKMFTQAFGSTEGSDGDGGDGGGGGIMGALGSLFGGMGNQGNISSGGGGMNTVPRPSPNPSNPYANQNVPKVPYTMPAQNPVPQSQPQPQMQVPQAPRPVPTPIPQVPTPRPAPQVQPQVPKQTRRRSMTPPEGFESQKMNLPSHAPTAQHPPARRAAHTPELMPVIRESDASESTLNL